MAWPPSSSPPGRGNSTARRCATPFTMASSPPRTWSSISRRSDMNAGVLSDRRGGWAFAAGCLLVTLGVGLHLPMFWMGRHTAFHLDGMPMGGGMLFGMGLIVAGIGVAAYGLLPRAIGIQIRTASRIAVHAPEDAPLSAAHWGLMAVLVVAL